MCGDFNATRFNVTPLTRAIKKFLTLYGSLLELVNPPLFGVSYTWNRMNNLGEASRIIWPREMKL